MTRALVLVPGHGVCIQPALPLEPESWVGIHPGEQALLVEHIRAGVEEAAALGAVLIFSGGCTRQQAGPLSEGQSYRDVAAAAGWWGHSELAECSHVEGHARDSLENLAFALGRHQELHGALPGALVLVGWGFKEERFHLHRRALGWGAEFRYQAVNDPPSGPALEAARRAELEKRQALEQDPLLQGEAWVRQRASRDPFGRGEPYSARFGPLCRQLFARPAP